MERIRSISAITTTDVRDSDTHTPPTHSRVKQPKLQLHSFSGNLTQWTSYWDSYQTAIHNNEQRTDIEKFNYLNSLLESSAREAISGFSLTAANYREAISLLKKRFGVKQHVVDKHLEELFNIELVVSANNVHGLRRLLDTVTSHIHSLSVQPATHASTFCPKLLTKLPNELRLIVSRTLRDCVKAVTTQAFVTIPRQAVLTLSKTVLADVFLLANLLIQVHNLQL